MSSAERTALVTGAGGFIAGRLVEVMHLTGAWKPRAGVRRWSTAARIGRLPIEIASCDVMDRDQLRSAMRGVDAVVHCATGPGDINAAGTRLVLEAAEEAGVRRVVHLSTIDVYGTVTGEVTEDSPLQRTGAAYGDSKIEAELACREAIARGLPVAILRPSIVYGPFSSLWTTAYARRLMHRPWPYPEALTQGICNLVYVDDVVRAIMRALDDEAAVGEAFNVNGPDRPTWHEYFNALNDALGLPPLTTVGERSAGLRVGVMRPLRVAARSAAQRGRRPLSAIARHSRLANSLMRGAEQAIRATPTTDEFRLYEKTAEFPTAKARRLLRYEPAFTMAEGVRLSAAWLQHHDYVTSQAIHSA